MSCMSAITHQFFFNVCATQKKEKMRKFFFYIREEKDKETCKSYNVREGVQIIKKNTLIIVTKRRDFSCLRDPKSDLVVNI